MQEQILYIKRCAIIFLIAHVLLPIPSFSANNSGNNIKRVEKYIAVFDIEATGKVDKDISRPLSETIRFEVVKIGKYEVIDRSNMDKILGEQKFQTSGCISGECVVEAGQLLGVGKIVTGSVNIVGNVYYLSLSLINVETGKIENVSEDKCSCEQEELINVSKKLARRLFENRTSNMQDMGEYTKPIKLAKDPITGMEFVFVKGGCFEMEDILGDGEANKKPAHKVCIDDFYIGRYEVTQGQWKKIMASNPSSFPKSDDYPVEQVSWDDAQEFIKKLNQKAGKKYRLPTEAEWEYAARSRGKNEKWAGTNDKLEVDDYAWYADNFGSSTHPVGKKKPNEIGLYDMTGNVEEWVADWYGSYSTVVSWDNPNGPISGKNKIVRGGRCANGLRHIRTTYRSLMPPSQTNSTTGFRLVF